MWSGLNVAKSLSRVVRSPFVQLWVNIRNVGNHSASIGPTFPWCSHNRAWPGEHPRDFVTAEIIFVWPWPSATCVSLVTLMTDGQHSVGAVLGQRRRRWTSTAITLDLERWGVLSQMDRHRNYALIRAKQIRNANCEGGCLFTFARRRWRGIIKGIFDRRWYPNYGDCASHLWIRLHETSNSN